MFLYMGFGLLLAVTAAVDPDKESTRNINVDHIKP